MGNRLLANRVWFDFILSQLSPEDDPQFWIIALNVMLREVEFDIKEAHASAEIYVQIGACSHWLRPHQTRWKAAGGFAWPAGYGAAGNSRLGLPDFDWSVLLRWERETGSWQRTENITGKRHFVLRAALPTRTLRHSQAAIHTIWLPSLLTSDEPKKLCLYGFRKIDGEWQCVAAQQEVPSK